MGAKALVVLIVCSVLAGTLILLQSTPAAAASYTFLVDSLSHQGDDADLGDGTCATADGTCTLRAALQQSNALPSAADVITIAPAADVDSATPGVQSSGTILGQGTGAANMMHVGVLTPLGDLGAYFMATRPVTLDFQNRLGIASIDENDGATALYINGPAVSVRNFASVKSNETAMVLGPLSDGSIVENGTCTDPGSDMLERCIWLAGGADSITIRNVQIGSTASQALGGGSAIRIAAGATINDLTIDRIRMFDPDTAPYHGLQMQGTATLNRLRITGSVFEGFHTGGIVLDFRDATLHDAYIVDNKFLRLNTTTWTTLAVNRSGSNNVISDNVVTNTSSEASNTAFYFYSFGLASTTRSGWTVRDNHFDGRRNWSVYLAPGTGTLPVEHNTFGLQSFGGGGVVNETGLNAFFYNDTSANQKINPWYPTAVALDSSTCTLDVSVTPPTEPPAVGTIPATPVTIDVYFTAGVAAEVHLGRQTGLTAAGVVAVPYTMGSGNIRLQTIGANGATSQYSRNIAVSAADQCGPTVAIDQSAAQADPTSVREIRYTVTVSETVADQLLPAELSTAGSTAPGATVTNVTRLSGNSFEVLARADGTGDVVLTVPNGALSDTAGNPSAASTSTDNQVSYVSPLSLTPTTASVSEDGTTADYTIASTLPATAPLTIIPSVADPAWVTAAPSPLVIDTIASSGTIAVAAVNNPIVDGARVTTIGNTVSSTDPNFDGLLLPDVAVTVADDDAPIAANSSLAVTSGTRTADGTTSHTATATARTISGDPVSGVIVTFQTGPGAVFSAPSCTTADAGECSVSIASSVAGTYEIHAFLNTTDEIAGSPASVEFVAPVDPGTSPEPDPPSRPDSSSLSTTGGTGLSAFTSLAILFLALGASLFTIGRRRSSPR